MWRRENETDTGYTWVPCDWCKKNRAIVVYKSWILLCESCYRGWIDEDIYESEGNIMALPYIVVNGRLTEDPTVKEINGDTVLNYRVASNQRRKNEQNEWVDVNTTYLDGSMWGKGATNSSLKKGDLVIIVGELKQRSYETKEGDKRTVYEIATESIGEAIKKY